MNLLRRFTYYLGIIAELSKVKITVAVSFTTFTGYVLAKHVIDPGFISATVGIFLLACGSSVINHIQEHRTDIKMNRTKHRPIPAKKISVSGAWLTALIEIVAGSYLLYSGSNVAGLVLGWLALFWYNGIYTLLKKYTAHAVIPGSLIGSIPPLVGWVTAGKDILTLQALGLAIFFFIWQIPHFYILMYKHSEDYREAGFPEIGSRLSEKAFKKLIFILICLMVISSFIFPLFGLTESIITFIGFVMIALFILWSFTMMIFSRRQKLNTHRYFNYINYYVLLIVCFLVLDHLFPFLM